jgi:hypothetical protein
MLYLALNYLRVGLQNEMQYRANFFVALGQSSISLASGHLPALAASGPHLHHSGGFPCHPPS